MDTPMPIGIPVADRNDVVQFARSGRVPCRRDRLGRARWGPLITKDI